MFALLFAALCAQGCIIIYPTREEKVLWGLPVNKQQLAFIRPGVTAKNEIIKCLGEPDALWEDERIFVYKWQMKWGEALVAAGHGLNVGGATWDIPKHYLLLVRFDPNDRVERLEVTTLAVFESYGEHLENWLNQKKHSPENEASEGPEESHLEVSSTIATSETLYF